MTFIRHLINIILLCGSVPGADLLQQEDRSLARFVYILWKARKRFAFIVCIAGVFLRQANYLHKS